MILSQNMLELLSRQYYHEKCNAFLYDYLQTWADAKGLDGTAKLMSEQALGELKHATLVKDYIVDRSQTLKMLPIVSPMVEPLTLIKLFEIVQAREILTTQMILNIKKQAEAENDMLTCAWLVQPTGLVIEQIEEEALVQTILDRIAVRTGGQELTPEAAHDIDVWVGTL